MTDESTRFLTVFEVAVILRVSKTTVYHLVHAGDLEAIKVNRSFRIPEHAVLPAGSSRGTQGRLLHTALPSLRYEIRGAGYRARYLDLSAAVLRGSDLAKSNGPRSGG
jgi:excisionase family DNA binding protein